MKKTDQLAVYFANVPAEGREVIGALHRLVLTLLPGAEAKISYGVPTYRFEGRGVIALGATKTGLSLHVMSTKVMAALKPALEKYGVSGATLKFTAEKPLPKTVVKKIIAARVAENRALDAKRKKAS